MANNTESRTLFAEHLWVPRGFVHNARVDVAGGTIAEVSRDAACGDAEIVGRWVIPGMPNVHSHAFQRAMAGLTERRPGTVATGEDREALIPDRTLQVDNFWTWREVMYAFAGRIDPDALHAIAAQLYVEMLKAGYTRVCEFHYLHQQPDGSPYADPAAMSLALIEAAEETGIGLTLLPTLYMTGGFDGRALSERQRRFGLDLDGYLRLVEQLRAVRSPGLRIGVAFHSLRAVPEDAMRMLLECETAHGSPIHIHIAEQIGEVQDCLAIRNARPVEWLLDHMPVDRRWCVVHATHLTDEETRRLAATGAVVGLCPTTEANLGDGIFPLKAWRDANGAVGIGSDSHVSVSPVEELRWLEYGQRLNLRHRNIAADPGASVGATLWSAAFDGGARACGIPTGVFAVNGGHDSVPARADLLVLDDESPLLAANAAASVLDCLVFAGNTPLVKHVMVEGTWRVRNAHHEDEERIAMRYRKTIEALTAQGN
ncbi:MAG: formimidoylglutamate deiminase [Rhodanobacteraceae bacterium]